jgi:hypothetical protein
MGGFFGENCGNTLQKLIAFPLSCANPACELQRSLLIGEDHHRAAALSEGVQKKTLRNGIVSSPLDSAEFGMREQTLAHLQLQPGPLLA